MQKVQREEINLFLNQRKIASNYADKILDELIKDLEPENLPKQYFFGANEAIQKLKFKKNRREIIG